MLLAACAQEPRWEDVVVGHEFKVPGHEESQLRVSLRYPRLVAGPDPEVCRGISLDVANEAWATVQDGSSDEVLVRDPALWDDEYLDYAAFMEKEAETGSVNELFPWYLEVKGRTVDSGPGRVAVVLEYGSFTGGAHPNFGRKYLNYDPVDGRRLGLEDLGDEKGLAGLKARAWDAFVQQREADDPGSVGEDGSVRGYFVTRDDFYLSPNWLLGADTLEFWYGPYELGPWVAGEVVLELPREELAGLLRL